MQFRQKILRHEFRSKKSEAKITGLEWKVGRRHKKPSRILLRFARRRHYTLLTGWKLGGRVLTLFGWFPTEIFCPCQQYTPKDQVRDLITCHYNRELSDPQCYHHRLSVQGYFYTPLNLSETPPRFGTRPHRSRVMYTTVHIQKRSSADADKPARRVQRSVKVTRHGTIRYVRYGFLLVCYSKFVPKPRRF